MLNKLTFLITLILSTTAFANVKVCNDNQIIEKFLANNEHLSEVVKCANNTTKTSLGFKKQQYNLLVVDSNIDNKIFYFSFPMIHNVQILHFENEKLVGSDEYSKVNNKGKEYIYFDMLGRSNNILVAITNTQNSVQLPFMTFDTNDEFQSFLKKRWMFDGIWFGVLFFTLMLTGSFFFLRKNKEIVFYSMHIFALFVIQLAFSGYLFSGFSWLPNYILSRAVVFSCSLLTIGTVGLIYTTFMDQRKDDKVIKVYGYVMAVAIIHFIASAIVYNQAIIKFTSYLTLLLSVSSITVCLYAIVRRLKYSTSFLLSFALFLFSSLAFTLKDLGVMDINEIQANYIVKLSLLVEIFILGVVIVRTLFEEAKIITNAGMHQMITNGNIKIIKKLQHDINSPFTSLEFFFMEAKHYLSEDLRNMGRQSINRIQDIINTLKINDEDSILEERSDKEVIALYPFLKRIISEKRIEYRDNPNVHISLDISGHKEHFVELRRSGFSRTMSNIINNSIEAKRDNADIYIVTHIEKIDDKIEIIVSDNGRGIAPENLSEVFEYGKSFEKRSGSGIGLNQSKDYIESENGEISIDSCVDQGTTLKIILNEVGSPSWYVDEIKLESRDVVVIDDDDSIHNLWDERLSLFRANVLHFKSTQEFETWACNNDLSKYNYLVDLELIGSEYTGLDLINQFQLNNKAILVTSHYLDKDIQKKCLKSSVKMIPKESVVNLNIKLTSTSIKKPKRVVLIDDDKFTHLNWKRTANNNGIDLRTYYLIDEFLAEQDIFDLNTPIYIDSNLGNGIKGEEEGVKIYELGFENLHLATGFSENDINVPYWIKSVQGKRLYV